MSNLLKQFISYNFKTSLMIILTEYYKKKECSGSSLASQQTTLFKYSLLGLYALLVTRVTWQLYEPRMQV